MQTNHMSKSIRFTSSLVAGFENMVNDLPMREAVRYTHGNIKVSATAFKVRNIFILYIYINTCLFIFIYI